MFERQLAIVTGGASGIGFGISEALIKAEYDVVLVGRNEERLASAAKKLGSAVQWRCADVGRRADMERAVGDFERVSLLINAAGFISPVSLVMPLDEAESNWDAVIDANLKGSFLSAMLVAPKLKSPGGTIINISSIGAQTGGSRPGGLAYAAAKAGIHGLTYALARELAPRGITANAIAPGFIAATGFTGAWPEDRVAEIVAQTPLGRPGTPADVAGAVLWLASEAGSFVTGTVIPVNGGWRIG
ncbi:SDR family oxidoreductase [Mesorhizobium sp. AD1-1]|uniref:SDR family NAD(P)-dependent oxidoreductase n=1 Tax=Mesorhizobium sp. AD1-1 TaxID=2876621 RepID=UPI001CC8FBAC|nr:SDR family NAD(P)-dependent oxidoreductase [Mesorhizobium sp. AD1-1]MBZ9719184.1 SDR family oxidoreductase [Mesorhizobium sp. AD1-1]